MSSAFFLSIDDIDNEIEGTSRKTSPLWNYITCNDSANPGVPICKRCNFVFSIKTGNSSIELKMLAVTVILRHSVICNRLQPISIKKQKL